MKPVSNDMVIPSQAYGVGRCRDYWRLATVLITREASERILYVRYSPNHVETRVNHSIALGALMLSMSCEHFEIGDFIAAKTSNDALLKANLSIRMNDGFMLAVENKEPYEQLFTRNDTTYNKTVDACQLFDELVDANYNWSEPGIAFWDRIENWNAMSHYSNYELVGLNPCGEVPLVAYGACLLGSINLSEMVCENGTFDFDMFGRTIEVAMRALNAVLDEGIPRHPLEEQRNAARDWRQIGLGVMGYADMLIKMNLRYGSDSAIVFTNKLASFMCDNAFKESAKLAGTFGAFPNYVKEDTLSSEFVNHNLSKSTIELISDNGLRNASILSIAPTGSISTMLDVSGGIEPLFALEYNRRTESLHDKDKSYVMRPGIVQQYVDSHGSCEYPSEFIVASEIKPIHRILTQSTWQEFIDSSISSTVNLANDSTVEDVRDVYIQAWKMGLKGVTVHREGSNREGILTTGESSKSNTEYKRGQWSKLDSDTIYIKRKIYTGCGKIALFIGHSKSTGKLQELYMKRSGKGGCERSLDSLVIAMSGMIRLGGSLDNIEKAIDGVGACSSFVRARANGDKLSSGSNCAYAIMNAIKDFYKPIIEIEDTSVDSCPECKSEIVFEAGCSICKVCGYSKCE